MTENNQKKKKKREKQRNEKVERKIKIVGDSIVHSLDFEKVEKLVGKVSVPGKEGPGAKYDRAYGSRYDPKAQFPNNNQEYKIQQLLARENADTLVFQASVTDITNLKNVPTTNTNFVHEKAAESSENVVNISIKVLEKDPELNVIIMQRPARYDSLADVSEWANFVLSCKVEKAKERFGDRLVLGEHIGLHTAGAVEARYGVKGKTPARNERPGSLHRQCYRYPQESWSMLRTVAGGRRPGEEQEARCQESAAQEAESQESGGQEA